MYGCDTGELPALDCSKMTRIPTLSVEDAIEVGRALETVREFEHGTGEVCIPLVNGLFDKIRIAITHYRAKKKQTR